MVYIPPVNSKGNYQPQFPEGSDLELEQIGLASDQKEFQKTAEKFLFENAPKALKNTAKFLMKVATAPPAFVLDFGGGILKNVGFFMRAAPMALGGAIGEKIAPTKDDVYQAKKIGKVVGFLLASPITVPATAIEFMGRAAHFAGNLHIKANIKEEIDLGIYLKHHFLNKSPADIKKDYAYELLKKNPSISIDEINDKFAFKFRNQKEFKNITFDKDDLQQYNESIIGGFKDERKVRVEELNKELKADKNMDKYIRAVESEVNKQCESTKLTPELKSEIINRAKAEASHHVSTEFPELFIQKVPKGADTSEKKRVGRALKNLDAHINKMTELSPDLKLGAIKAFLENNPKGKFLLRNEDRKELLIAHLISIGLSNEEINLIFKSKIRKS